MKFSDKLNFMMTITNTTNSALAGRILLDASYISRLRRGKRLKPKDEGIIQSMAASLARRCSDDYQIKAVSDALKLTIMPSDSKELAEAVADWLINDDAGVVEQVGNFLNGLSGMGRHSVTIPPKEECRTPFPLDMVSVYYGVEGKRRAAEYFLMEVAECEKPQTLLLFSDEETSWMTADPKYARRWAELMIRVLSGGNKIKIIHTISRYLDEMMSAISQWVPLYMSGNIEPYFYPKKRDGVFKRTLFIAPETAAVVSNSIGDQISLSANVLYRDRAVVACFKEEFMQYLQLCRPLMRIFTVRDRDACYDTLTEFEHERADTLMKTESLSILTMSENLLESIVERSGLDVHKYSTIHNMRRRYFFDSLKSNRFTEIIHLPDIETVKQGSVKVSMSYMLEGGTLFYTPQEYCAHLEQVKALLVSCENYHVFLADISTEEQYTVYAREELGVIVAKISQPPIVLALNESNMVAAFWDFLKDMVDEKSYLPSDKAEVIDEIQKYIVALRG